MARRDSYDSRSDAGLNVEQHGPSSNGRSRGRLPPGPASAHDNRPPVSAGNAYTVMVAGQSVGKTSFLRLLLDTSDIAPNADPDQAANVAKFVQGAASRTTHVRSASIQVQADLGNPAERQPVNLTVIDTPSLDMADLDLSLQQLLSFLEDRFLHTMEDEHKARSGDHHVHLCIYLIDPDTIQPPMPPGLKAPSLSPSDLGPRDHPPTLAPVEIKIIRQLSARVNVLPVISRADTVTLERLTVIKLAVRRALADHGIGFGIFDSEHDSRIDPLPSSTGALNSPSSSLKTPPTSPILPVMPRLPHTIVSPDMYAHGDGVARAPLPSRQELAQRYSPGSSYRSPPSRSFSTDFASGKFTRAYRWGSINVLDPNHCDFVHLRTAIFHHMQPLKAYTMDYLFDKFRGEVQQRRQHIPRHPSPTPVSLPQVHYPPPHSQQLPPISTVAADIDSHGRPHLSPDLQHPSLMSRHAGHPSLTIPYGGVGMNSEHRSLPPLSLSAPHQHTPVSPGAQPMGISLGYGGSGSVSYNGSRKDVQKQKKNKKITVACNFCRSRKLKCDGGRPACSQCIKRSHICDYMPQAKRRGGTRQQRQPDDASDGEAYSSEEKTFDVDEKTGARSEAGDASLAYPSPNELHGQARGLSRPLSRNTSRRSSNVDMLIAETLHSPSGNGEHEGAIGSFSPMNPSNSSAQVTSTSDGRGFSYGMDKPLIAPLPFSGAHANVGPNVSPSTTSPPVPIRPATEAQAAQRKRAVITGGKGARSSSNYGPKVVACNFCRARKTKCDGQHPSCSSCSRRSLPCDYVNVQGASGAGTGRRKSSAASVSEPITPVTTQGSAHSQDSSRAHSPPHSASESISPTHMANDVYLSYKRNFAEDDPAQSPSVKKYRVDQDADVDNSAGTPRPANGQTA